MTNPIESPLALLAGLATVASPCVLPVLPFLLGASVEQSNRRRPLLIVAGFVLSFSAFALALGAVSSAAQLAQETLRNLAIVLLGVSGLLRIWPRPWDLLVERVRLVWASVRGGRADAVPRQSGAFVLGLSLGAVWTPCAGPVLASILALVVQAHDPARAVRLVGLYALGAALPMLALIHGGQAIVQRVRGVARHAVALQRAFGVLVLASAAAIWFQVDTQIAAHVPSIFPTL
ncbi:cytochrome c biogenesis CcdA family protein [Massilia pinisoli]|uniref:Cytochrome c biogenesis CcdA family protein n=1 Tax=Massilia pinisoli TaxID=1772194 RepID=A0ABT1ZP40_9BURK|nr:cytochrome c biogenesis CcdA family protein [Massilia pinisoli]MCS0581682.1 cytochrome c biogenesis CcdA family protein [Massilia pinisoli]